MIDIHDAIELAKKYYAEKGLDELTKVYDAEEAWIVFAGKEDQPKYGSSGVAIDKGTGEINPFILPSRENFEILKNATLIEKEEED